MARSLKKIVWRLSARTFRDFKRLWESLGELHQAGEADSDEAYAIEDQIRALPGFPHWNDPERHEINFTITSVT